MPIPFVAHIRTSRFKSPYDDHRKQLANMDEYGSSGRFPTDLALTICCIVGSGFFKRNQDERDVREIMQLVPCQAPA